MARRHGGLGRGLDALIPMREEVEKAMQSAGSENVEVFFADDDDSDEPVSVKQTPVIENREQNVSRETQNEIKELKDFEERDSEPVTVRISEVEPNRQQPRKAFDEEKLEELSASIKTYGLLSPILVQKRDGYYEIIAGERRWRAALKAGLKEIPVIIRDYSEKEILELSLIENIQREDLNPIEEAKAYKRLMDEFDIGQAEVAERVSKSRSAVANSVRLLKLGDPAQQMLVDGQISMGHARALLPLEDSDKQTELAQKIVDQALSVRDTEKIVKEILSGESGKETETVKPREQEEDPGIAVIYKQIEERLQQTLHTKVSIQRKRNGHGKLQIEFYNNDDLDKIIDKLTGN
ncbi:MAG: ParB/RepB/Spo0J family partition protein [Lachnospiraceae bacterium]|nr:ParB/RepB/Spo0J family partition protein [Lachnospiraceae bacterium]